MSVISLNQERLYHIEKKCLFFLLSGEGGVDIVLWPKTKTTKQQGTLCENQYCLFNWLPIENWHRTIHCYEGHLKHIMDLKEILRNVAARYVCFFMCLFTVM